MKNIKFEIINEIQSDRIIIGYKEEKEKFFYKTIKRIF